MGKATADLSDPGKISGFHQCLLVATPRLVLEVEVAKVCNLDVKLNPGGKETTWKTLGAPLHYQTFLHFQNSCVEQGKRYRKFCSTFLYWLMVSTWHQRTLPGQV